MSENGQIPNPLDENPVGGMIEDKIADDGARVVTFGCRMNSYESQVIKKHADDAGMRDAIVVNTCTVTREAERQARQTIRKLRRENPLANIIVTGCAAQVNPEQFSEMDEVNHVIGNHEKMQADSYNTLSISNSEKVIVNDIMSVEETASHMVAGFYGRTRAFVQVQNGCNHRCTFCIIPYGRGNSRSVPMGEVVGQIKKLVQNGYQEVVLTGVDISSYGEDLPGSPTLGEMVRRLLKTVPTLPRLRISSIDCIEIDEDLFQVMADEPRLMPHMHLSLQSGDNTILRRMARRHNRDHAIELCARLRHARPDLILGADLITGFPTETEDMFQNTLDIVEACDLTYLHVFPYSERPGTPAARIPARKQVPVPERKARAKRLRELGKQRENSTLNAHVGTTAHVLFEQNNTGHTEHYLPVKLQGVTVPDGTLTHVRIDGVDGKYLLASQLAENTPTPTHKTQIHA